MKSYSRSRRSRRPRAQVCCTRHSSLVTNFATLITYPIHRERNIIESQCRLLTTNNGDPNPSPVFAVFFGFKPTPDGTAKQGKGVRRGVSRFDEDAQGDEVRRNYEDLDRWHEISGDGRDAFFWCAGYGANGAFAAHLSRGRRHRRRPRPLNHLPKRHLVSVRHSHREGSTRPASYALLKRSGTLETLWRRLRRHPRLDPEGKSGNERPLGARYFLLQRKISRLLRIFSLRKKYFRHRSSDQQDARPIQPC